MTPTQAPPRRRWLGVLMKVLAALALVFVALATWSLSVLLMWEDCPGYDDEGIVAAPKSLQGRVMCSDDGVQGQYYALALMVILAVLALVTAIRRREATLALILLAVMSIVPIPVTMVMQALPDECTSGQWDKYGDEGCQTDLEK